MINRREFIAVTASSGVALGMGSRSIASAAEVPSAANTVVVGIMGMSRGRVLADGFHAQPGVEIAYLCDVDSGRLGKVAGEFSKSSGKNPKRERDFRRILDDPSVDALVIATPNHWHAPATIMACAAGKHVYVEKPCSHNPAEGEMMIEAARKHKRHVQMGSQRRSVQQFVDVIQQIHDGTIGRVYLAQAWYTNNRPSIGRGQLADVPADLDFDLWQGPAPRQPFRSNLLHYNWHWMWHWGNGELGNNGIHSLDLCRWGLQVDFPTRVLSGGGRYGYRDDDQQTPDTNFVAFEFDGNKSITWEGLSCNRLEHAQGDLQGTMVHFHGDKGSLAIGDWGYVIYDIKGKVIRSVGDQSKRADYAGFVSGHVANFVSAIRGMDKLNAEIEVGHKSTMLCHLGNISYRVGRSIRCRPEDGQILGDSEAAKLWTREYEPGWKPKV